MRLSALERECQDLIAIVIDMMAPGKRINTIDHTELLGRLRMASAHLINKEYGCVTGKHASFCHCKKEDL